MPQYLSPGVYVEEVPSGPRLIAGVSTSTAGFIGMVADDVNMPPQPGKFQTEADGSLSTDASGNLIPVPFDVAPALEPQLITTWLKFKNVFGDIQQDKNGVLAQAVYGFFNNGGSRCWVTRLSAFPGVAAVRAVLEKFARIDEISLVAIPGVTAADVQTEMLDHCEKVEGRFGILDGQEAPNALTKDAVQGTVRTSNNAAMYFPWIDLGVKNDDGTIVYYPPSGHLAGVYARVDKQRGVHKAPANEVIRGAIGVKARLSKADQDALNPHGINVIRQLNGNVTVWGARTISRDPEWKYVNVRRLSLFLEESINKATQWVVFEPNEEDTWVNVERTVGNFLQKQWMNGALMGSKPEQAYYVECSRRTMTQNDIDNGRLICEIGVAPIKPAEFVIFRICQKTADAT